MLKCENCIHMVKRHDQDGYGNIHIMWHCMKWFYNLYYQINYDEAFLADLKLKFAKGEWLPEHIILPDGKNPLETNKVEVIYRKEIKECKEFKPQAKPLTEFKT